ncbi:preprotein translocase subunit YajC [Microlunatus sagamiharensis]|uniref:Preprotein translocase subunit YajC n=1 Tax=Microlunatus sagamiharensis TaxID=546874 RepID=A0A1H2M7R6_9ACTN|nr:preprotein translocase subunit YajC [Microlunatus sagamiharensis]SDU89055.1 preprotein translocase subunit YajC [Microlunatus sagamiharensis]
MSQQSSTLILVLLMVVAFYFLILRPQKKRQQAMQKVMRELEPGDRVLLGSGLFGTLVSIGDKQAVMEISPGVELTVLKQAIVRRATEADEDSVTEDEVGEELEAEATATYDTGDVQPVVRADADAPTGTYGADGDRSNLR